ncbi:efflux RND transporter periplasmic adaptor subunit [Methylobacterium haplocladii]|uniref:Hemolysin secretion protein D n=1 Tax=Methylobacterium haplocladii TaxID=1176176 RepID=A0A512IIZ4_9HYPH|nr:efflux RND transporter periplasmic adaptor subunit [Methylobacterium haplocladii]GEO97679.1 hemolysin secretion protein D [Methylobacterium haplocladii]GJD84446.1 Multidrug resistance protein MdtA [Methylobacterium haplocladii]GLS57409.1 hemolysin secretion protein D [Methylobacterium haplocladii]
MDARTPVEPEADSARAYFEATRERPRRASMLTLGLLLSVVVALVAAVAIWPQPVRDLAEKSLALAQDMMPGKSEPKDDEGARSAKRNAAAGERVFRPTKEQRTALEIKPVAFVTFRPEYSAEGRIAVNEDDNVPVTSPYSGRVTKVLARAGDDVKAGQVLLTIEASDMVQAQNDYQGALNGLDKARALYKLEQNIAVRQQELFQARATALKDYESAQNDVIAAQSDLKTAEATLQAGRNKLRLLGKTDEEISAFEKAGRMSAETEVRAPIAGTIVQRKVGVGQYISSSGDPLFVIGDLSTVWLIANVRESEVPKVRIGQEIDARVVGFPRTIFRAKISYIATSLDPATRRLGVRSELDNPDRSLKPEMFANFTIVTGGDRFSPSVPSAAVVYEGDKAHVWVSRPDGAIEARDVKLGLTNGDNVQVVEGLKTGEEVVTRGAIFIDRAATGSNAS